MEVSNWDRQAVRLLLFIAFSIFAMFQPVNASETAFSATVAGSTNPTVGATVTVYAGGPETATAIGSGTTDASGQTSFMIENPGGDAVLYAIAIGGDDGHGANPAMALISVFGTGSSYVPSILIDELTTVASVWSMANFIHENEAIFGSSPGLQNAALTVTNLTDLEHGLPSTQLLNNINNSPAKLNTLSNVLTACTGSNGASSPNCGALFKYSSLAGRLTPTDTLAAAVNIARNPNLSLSPLYTLSRTIPDYGPSFPAPPLNWLLSLNLPTQTLAIAIDGAGYIWAGVNNGGLARFTPNGTQVAGSPYTGGGLTTVADLAIDSKGNVWTVSGFPTITVSEFDPNGVPLSPDSGYPVAQSYESRIAVDQAGNAWVTG